MEDSVAYFSETYVFIEVAYQPQVLTNNIRCSFLEAGEFLKPCRTSTAS